jgi:plasmid stability protein
MIAPMNPSPPSRSADQFVVRLPEGLRDTLKARAAGHNRSMNAEIVAILGAAISEESSLGAASVETLLKAVADRMGTALQINVMDAASVVPTKTSAKSKKP